MLNPSISVMHTRFKSKNCKKIHYHYFKMTKRAAIITTATNIKETVNVVARN